MRRRVAGGVSAGRFETAMMLGTFILLLMQTSGAAAQWSDEQLLHAGGHTFLLSEAVDTVLFEAPAMRDNLKRIGLPETCRIARAANKAAVNAGTPVFRMALIRTMRAKIPAERLTGVALPAFNSLPAYKVRVAEALEQDGSSGIANTRVMALERFAREATAAPSTTAPWADIFGDWDLDRASAVRSACVQYFLEDPAIGKRIFDQFYQRKEAH